MVSVDIQLRYPNAMQPLEKKYNDLITIIGLIFVSKSTNQTQNIIQKKQWAIFKVGSSTSQETEIQIQNNPTLNYAELVLQPQTLDYATYHIYFSVTFKLNENNLTKLTVDTFLRVNASGLALSTLKLSKPMFGGMIEITRGRNQTIDFDPFLFTYDIDGKAVITQLSFRYTCELVINGMTSMTNLIYLDEAAKNTSFTSSCFSSLGNLLNVKVKIISKNLRHFY
jgi:hypothetical protein